MMSTDQYNTFCATLAASTHVVQWGGAHVWKVGGKVFAIAGWSKGELPFVTFKCSEIAYEVLRELPGLRPAPYLAARGGKWIQMHGEPGLSDADMQAHIFDSYRMVVKKLTGKLRAELNLEA